MGIQVASRTNRSGRQIRSPMQLAIRISARPNQTTYDEPQLQSITTEKSVNTQTRDAIVEGFTTKSPWTNSNTTGSFLIEASFRLLGANYPSSQMPSRYCPCLSP